MQINSNQGGYLSQKAGKIKYGDQKIDLAEANPTILFVRQVETSRTHIVNACSNWQTGQLLNAVLTKFGLSDDFGADLVHQGRSLSFSEGLSIHEAGVRSFATLSLSSGNLLGGSDHFEKAASDTIEQTRPQSPN